MPSSTASGSFVPSPEKNLMPLSSYGLWLAEITTPAVAYLTRALRLDAGVGIGPQSTMSTPALEKPA